MNGSTKKRHSALSAENPKRSKQAQEEELRQNLSTYEASLESASTSSCQDEPQVDGLAEVVIEFDIKLSDACKRREKLLEVLIAEIALRNTSGGIIKINSPEKPTVKDRDDLMKELYEKRKTLLGSECGENDSFDDIIDIQTKESTTYIFVRKSSVPILTDDSHLRQRSEERNYKVILYSRICEVLNRRKRRCICANGEKFKTSFCFGDTLSYETMTEEHKLLNPKKAEKLAKNLCDKLSDNVVAFANTQGGTIYFGIEDNNASIKGQKIKDDEEKADIHRSIVECIERKLWALDSGEEYKPEEGADYYIKFFPLDRGDDNRFVIAVHICAFPGAAVFRKTPECSVLNPENEIVHMRFNEWLFLHKPTSVGNSAYQERFVQKQRGTSIYYSVKEMVEKFVVKITSASAGQLKLHPSHAVKWISHPALNMFVNATEKIFQKNNWRSGIAYIERCWEVNLGLPSTKPDNVICDVLLCCPQMPLVFVSLTHSHIPDEASHLYNKRLAARLKATLVQEADCLEKFYVKPVVISHWKLEAENTTWIYSENPRYPEAYRMNDNTYPIILEALVLVLARANVMSSHIVGQSLFNLLTYEQYKILHEFYEGSPKVKITGPPGSGKTVLALERIHRLRNQGYTDDEVLFLCSNKPLKARVTNMKTRDKQPLCTVMTYYDVDNLVRLGRLDIELGTIKHILADETQNYQDNDSYLHSWWPELQRLCDDKEDSSFWVFFDVAQKIHKKKSVSLRMFSKKELKTIIRQTVNVHRFITDKYMNVDSQVEMGHDLEGQKVDVLVPSDSSPTHNHLLYILINQLYKLIVKDGHHKNDITVLFSDVKQKDFYQPLFAQRTSNSCPVRNGEEVKKHGVVFDTIRRYCGVDNNIVLGFCPEFYTSNAQSNDALMATLCSRTKLKLILIFENEQQARCFNLAPTELKHVKCGNIRKVVNFSR